MLRDVENGIAAEGWMLGVWRTVQKASAVDAVSERIARRKELRTIIVKLQVRCWELLLDKIELLRIDSCWIEWWKWLLR